MSVPLIAELKRRRIFRVLIGYAILLVTLGRFEEARVEAERALELDPASAIVNNMLGVVFYESRDYDKAIAAFRKTLELNPGFAPAREILACAYATTGRKADALAELDQIKARQQTTSQCEPGSSRRLETRPARGR